MERRMRPDIEEVISTGWAMFQIEYKPTSNPTDTIFNTNTKKYFYPDKGWTKTPPTEGRVFHAYTANGTKLRMVVLLDVISSYEYNMYFFSSHISENKEAWIMDGVYCVDSFNAMHNNRHYYRVYEMIELDSEEIIVGTTESIIYEHFVDEYSMDIPMELILRDEGNHFQTIMPPKYAMEVIFKPIAERLKINNLKNKAFGIETMKEIFNHTVIETLTHNPIRAFLFLMDLMEDNRTNNPETEGMVELVKNLSYYKMEKALDSVLFFRGLDEIIKNKNDHPISLRNCFDKTLELVMNKMSKFGTDLSMESLIKIKRILEEEEDNNSKAIMMIYDTLNNLDIPISEIDELIEDIYYSCITNGNSLKDTIEDYIDEISNVSSAI